MCSVCETVKIYSDFGKVPVPDINPEPDQDRMLDPDPNPVPEQEPECKASA